MAELYDLSDLEMLAKDCLTRAGVSEGDAQTVARDVALAEVSGDRDSGFEALLRDIRLLRYGRVHLDAVAEVTMPAGAVLAVDARHGFAASALSTALPNLIDMALREGLALLHLTNSSDPGAMAGAMTGLASAGLVGISLRPSGAAFAVRPGAQAVTPFEPRTDTMLSSLLSMAPAPTDSPLDGPVAHSGWIAALNPDVTAGHDLLNSLPTVKASPTRAGVALAPDLLAQIVNA
ncbi:Ldh family oxidoreductase [Gymnodinialimonas hymeniacidonis]|uniref:Ldh family oxidoreductase n=1 Tax=Gymnodinialimonas hymeniacidonis TaxID=3126508 RepID=UPI0034C5E8E6